MSKKVSEKLDFLIDKTDSLDKSQIIFFLTKKYKYNITNVLSG